MKDYRKIAEKIRKMGEFSDIYNCGCPTEHCPINLCCKLSEPYIIDYTFYVAYDWGKWSIDYTLDFSVRMRSEMQHIRGIKTDKDMYADVEQVINKIREYCGVNTK